MSLDAPIKLVRDEKGRNKGLARLSTDRLWPELPYQFFRFRFNHAQDVGNLVFGTVLIGRDLIGEYEMDGHALAITINGVPNLNGLPDRLQASGTQPLNVSPFIGTESQRITPAIVSVEVNERPQKVDEGRRGCATPAKS
ncbi:MAG: hypothetical protein ACE5PV_11430 [Candidatus Poribacteria bacterium]